MYSIIMPAYNAEKTISRSIESILHQNFKDWELVIINDGSVDSTKDIIKSFCAVDNRIVLLEQKNAGPGVARNNGIHHSYGEYIAFLDADDYWEPDFLKLVDEKVKTEKSDVVFLDIIVERVDGSIIEISYVHNFEGLKKNQMVCNVMVGKMPWGMSKVIKKEILEQFNQGFLHFSVGEETIFSYEVIKRANKVSFVNKPIYHYVQRSESQHKKGDYDPWHPVVDNMRNYLIKTGDYSIYESTINALALKALSIAVYRYSCRMNFLEAVKNIKTKHNEYQNAYDFKNINYYTLDKKTILIDKLLKVHLYVALYLASKLRFKKRIV